MGAVLFWDLNREPNLENYPQSVELGGGGGLVSIAQGSMKRAANKRPNKMFSSRPPATWDVGRP